MIRYGLLRGSCLLQGYQAVDLPGRTQSKEPCLSLSANTAANTSQSEANRAEKQAEQHSQSMSILPQALAPAILTLPARPWSGLLPGCRMGHSSSQLLHQDGVGVWIIKNGSSHSAAQPTTRVSLVLSSIWDTALCYYIWLPLVSVALPACSRA